MKVIMISFWDRSQSDNEMYFSNVLFEGGAVQKFITYQSAQGFLNSFGQLWGGEVGGRGLYLSKY